MLSHIGVIPIMPKPKPIPTVTVDQDLNYGDGDTSNFQKKAYLTVYCIFLNKYSCLVIFTCTTRPARRPRTGLT